MVKMHNIKYNKKDNMKQKMICINYCSSLLQFYYFQRFYFFQKRNIKEDICDI